MTTTTNPTTRPEIQTVGIRTRRSDVLPTAPKIAGGAVVLTATPKPSLATRLNRVQIALASLTTGGAVIVGVCAALAPSLLMTGLAIGCAASTVIHWQLCD